MKKIQVQRNIDIASISEDHQFFSIEVDKSFIKHKAIQSKNFFESFSNPQNIKKM
jgi:hypothetical protein